MSAPKVGLSLAKGGSAYGLAVLGESSVESMDLLLNVDAVDANVVRSSREQLAQWLAHGSRHDS